MLVVKETVADVFVTNNTCKCLFSPIFALVSRPHQSFIFGQRGQRGVEQRSRDGVLKDMLNTMGTVRNRPSLDVVLKEIFLPNRTIILKVLFCSSKK